MVNQKLISFKVDEDLLPQLDSLCLEYGLKRNKMLNTLCRVGIVNMAGNSSRFGIMLALSSVEF